MKITMALLGAMMLVLPLSAWAALGGDISSVEADTAQSGGTVRILKMATHSVHEIRTASGVMVREYVSPAGKVFGVAWQGPANPDLRQVLGAYYDQLTAASRAASGPVRGRPFVIQEPNLVVQMSGTMRAHFGRAYDPTLLPPQIPPATIR
jgi:uncharacterized protein DUF2844